MSTPVTFLKPAAREGPEIPSLSFGLGHWPGGAGDQGGQLQAKLQPPEAAQLGSASKENVLG